MRHYKQNTDSHYMIIRHNNYALCPLILHFFLVVPLALNKLK